MKYAIVFASIAASVYALPQGASPAAAAQSTAKREEQPLCNGKSAFDIPGVNCQDWPAEENSDRIVFPKATAKREELPLCNGKSAFDIPGVNCREWPAEELPLCNGKSAFDIPGVNCQDWPAPQDPDRIVFPDN